MRSLAFSCLCLPLAVALLSGCGAIAGLESSYELDESPGPAAGGASQGGAGGQQAGASGTGEPAGQAGAAPGGQGGATAGAAGKAGGAGAAGGTAGSGGGAAGAGGTAGAGGAAGTGGGAAGTGGGAVGCQEGVFRCNGDDLEVCQQKQFEVSDLCDAGLCNAAAGKCNACVPSSSTCSETGQRLVCDAMGNGQSVSPCVAPSSLCAQGQCVECQSVADCKQPDNPCERAICLKGTCELEQLKVTDPVLDLIAGDCQQTICMQGTQQMVPDATDVPDDHDPCTFDGCLGGQPTSTTLPPGSPCGDASVCLEGGACADCLPKAVRCAADGSLEECSAIGAWQAAGVCVGGETCAGGACVCASQTVCGGVCVDPQTDSGHCGGCDLACPAGRSCAGGACQCPVAECQGACVDTSTDRVNCGACGKKCNAQETCSGGVCECPTTRCLGVCKDLDNDPDNCGGCGNPKTGTNVCQVACSRGQCATVVDVAIGGTLAGFTSKICAIFSDQTVRCILHPMETGGLPAPSPEAGTAPWYVDGLPPVKSLAVGPAHSCAILGTDEVSCSGDNQYGQLGLGEGSPTPVVGFAHPVAVGPGCQQLAVGYLNSGVVQAGAGVFFGYNENPNLFGIKDGTTLSVFTPASNTLLKAIAEVQLSATIAVVCARLEKSGQNLSCWGNNQTGTIGRGMAPPNDHLPGLVQSDEAGFPPLTNASALALRSYHACAVVDDPQTPGAQAAYCWGYNTSGQANPDDPATSVFYAHRIGPAIGVAVGSGHSCLLGADGRVACWGENTQGQLGRGTQGSAEKVPTTIAGLGGVQKIRAAGTTTCAIDAAGQLFCWGFITYGNVILTPTPVSFPTIHAN